MVGGGECSTKTDSRILCSKREGETGKRKVHTRLQHGVYLMRDEEEMSFSRISSVLIEGVK